MKKTRSEVPCGVIQVKYPKTHMVHLKMMFFFGGGDPWKGIPEILSCLKHALVMMEGLILLSNGTASQRLLIEISLHKLVNWWLVLVQN